MIQFKTIDGLLLRDMVMAGTALLEKNREVINYDYKTSGIDYSKGTDHLVDGTHFVKCTDEEFAALDLIPDFFPEERADLRSFSRKSLTNSSDSRSLIRR